MVSSGVAGCGGEEEGSEVKIVSEPAATGDLHQAAEISTSRGNVCGVLYPFEGVRGAVVMVGGAGGDTTGPAGIYDGLATRLQAGGTEALRLEYRTPNHLDECVYDLLAGVEALVGRGPRGWSS